MIRKLTLLLLLIQLGFSGFATNYLNIEITYQSVDSLEFDLKVSTFRDCRGIQPPAPQFFISHPDGSRSLQLPDFDTSRTVINEVGLNCATYSCGGSAFGKKGVVRTDYYVTVDFTDQKYNTLKSNCTWRFYVQPNSRPGAITTGVSGQFFTFAELNWCEAPNATSPEPKPSDLYFISCDQGIYRNVLPNKTGNMDSVSVNLIQPLTDHQSAANYSSGFSFTNPYTVNNTIAPKPKANPPIGFYFDESIGELVFTPTNCQEVTAIKFGITGWKQKENGEWKKVSFVTQEQVSYVDRSLFTQPSLDTSFLSLKFTPNSFDTIFQTTLPLKLTAGSRLEIGEFGGLEDVTWSIDSSVKSAPRLKLIYQPQNIEQITSRQTHYLTVQLLDDVCPFNGFSEHTIKLMVEPFQELSEVLIRPFLDENGDCIRQSGENVSNETFWNLTSTDLNSTVRFDQGSQSEMVRVKPGSYKLNLLEDPEFVECQTLSFDTKEGAITVLEPGFYRKSETVYGDVMVNDGQSCTLSPNAIPASGLKLVFNPGEVVTYTDHLGHFAIQLSPGTYTMTVEPDPTLGTSCVTTQNFTIAAGNEVKLPTMVMVQQQTNVKLDALALPGAVSTVGSNQIRLRALNENPNRLVNATILVQLKSKNKLLSDSVQIALAGGESYEYNLQFSAQDVAAFGGDEVDISAILKVTDPQLNQFKEDDELKRLVPVINRANKTSKMGSPFVVHGDPIPYSLNLYQSGSVSTGYAIWTDTISSDLDLLTFSSLQKPTENLRFWINGDVLKVRFTRIGVNEKPAPSSFGYTLLPLPSTAESETIENSATVMVNGNTSGPFEVTTQLTNPITVDTVHQLPVCGGDSLTFEYQFDFSFDDELKSDVLLSDPSGDFNNALKVGEFKLTENRGELTVALPADAAASSNYRIRILTEDPLRFQYLSEPSDRFQILDNEVPELKLLSKECEGETVTVIPVSNYEGMLELKSSSSDLNATAGNGGYVVMDGKTGDQLWLKGSKEGNCVANSDTLTMAYFSVPQLDIQAPTAQCEELEVEFKNETGGDDFVNYTVFWGDANQTVTPTFNTVKYLYDEYGSKTWRVSAESKDGCTSESTGTISLIEQYDADFQLNWDEDCLNGNVFTAWDFEMDPSIDHLWDNGDGSVTEQGFFITGYTEPGTYTVTHYTNKDGFCPDSSTQTLVVKPSPSAEFQHEISCTDQPARFISLDKSTVSEDVWTVDGKVEGETQRIEEYITVFREPGTYKVARRVELDGCIDSFSVNHVVRQAPEFQVGHSLTNNEFEVELNSRSELGELYSYLWSFPDGTAQSGEMVFFKAETADSVELDVTGTSNNGCSTTISYKLDPVGNITFFFPNSFSPNGDGLNDQFSFPNTEYVEDFHIVVYSKWNHMIYEGFDPHEPIKLNEWIPGTYLVKIFIVDIKGKKHEYSGPLTVVK
jgi:hypothetical protein